MGLGLRRILELCWVRLGCRVGLRLRLRWISAVYRMGRCLDLMGRLHWGLLRRHLGSRIVRRSRLLRLVVLAERVAVENKGRNEQKPGQAQVSTGPSPSNTPIDTSEQPRKQDKTHITSALRPAIALMTASATRPATAALLSRPRFETTQWPLLTVLPSFQQ
jgi:hypothetical protein